MWYGYLQTSAFLTLVGATAIIPYIIYFLITVAYAVKRRTTDSIPGAFTLGRWAWPVIGFVLVYTVIIMLALSLPGPFHGSDKVLAAERDGGSQASRRTGQVARSVAQPARHCPLSSR